MSITPYLNDNERIVFMKDLTKYAYCNNCDKRLFPIKEYYKAMYK